MKTVKLEYRNYYKTNGVEPLPSVDQREFGFIFHNAPFMVRHIGFPSQERLERFLWQNTPKHSYMSVSYYEYPKVRDMVEKVRHGADLIFDLDADHIPACKYYDNGKRLLRVKRETFKLIDVLLKYYRFDEDDLQVVFSGGRGYHVYVSGYKVAFYDWKQRKNIAIEVRAKYGIFIDVPVTKDEFRLIRIPGSIHGDANLLCKTVALNDLEDFNPLEECKINGS